jgi:hypothetical protein
MSEEDPRVRRLPAWARELIRGQASRIARLEQDVSDLRDHAGSFIAAEEDCDTLRLSDRALMADGSDMPDMALGNGAVIRFADWYQVRYGYVGSGGRALIVETDGDMVVAPVYQGKIIVRRADTKMKNDERKAD